MINNKTIIRIIMFLFMIFESIHSGLISQNAVSYTVFFSSDSSSLTSNEKSKFYKFIKSLDVDLISKVTINGYCDDEGSTSYNRNLSLRRAECIKQILIKSNFDSTLITNVEGKGEMPLMHAINESVEEQRTLSRKTEITFFRKSNAAPKKQNRGIDSLATFKNSNKRNKIITSNLKIGDTLILENIVFQLGLHRLEEESYPILDNLVRELTVEKKYNILILGHVCCQPPGSEDVYDSETGIRNLSVARAKEIYDYLIKNGISPDRLGYKGLKSDYPTGKGGYYDKRVEITITNIKQ